MTCIFFKESSVESVNQALLSNKYLHKIHIQTQDDLEKWALDIRNGQCEGVAFNGDTEMTVEKLQKTIPYWTRVNCIDIDPYFGRTDEKVMAELLTLCSKHVSDITSIECGRTLYERAEREGYDDNQWLALEEKDKEGFRQVANPEASTHKYPSGGTFVYNDKQRQGKKIHILFGRCPNNSPTLLRRRDYLTEQDNAVYENELGERFLLIPLIPMDNTSVDIIWKSYCGVFQFIDISLAAFSATIYAADITEESALESNKEIETIFSTDTFTSMIAALDSKSLPYQGAYLVNLKQLTFHGIRKSLTFRGCMMNTPNAITLLILYAIKVKGLTLPLSCNKEHSTNVTKELREAMSI